MPLSFGLSKWKIWRVWGCQMVGLTVYREEKTALLAACKLAPFSTVPKTILQWGCKLPVGSHHYCDLTSLQPAIGLLAFSQTAVSSSVEINVHKGKHRLECHGSTQGCVSLSFPISKVEVVSVEFSHHVDSGQLHRCSNTLGFHFSCPLSVCALNTWQILSVKNQRAQFPCAGKNAGPGRLAMNKSTRSCSCYMYDRHELEMTVGCLSLPSTIIQGNERNPHILAQVTYF